MNKKLLNILACPVTKGPLIYDKKNNRLISCSARLAYLIKEGIPVLQEEEAIELSSEDVEKYRS